MAIKKYTPYTPSRRNMATIDYQGLTKEKSPKSLLVSLKKTGGRNNHGVITTRHKGGGSKRKYRVIDFVRNRDGIEGVVHAISYDPNRTAYIALINYLDGLKSYILAPSGLAVGDKVSSGVDVEIKVGNALPLKNIPDGTMIHNIELYPGKGGQFVRSAGTSAQLQGKDGNHAIIRLASGESRKVLVTCRATIGSVSNGEHNLVNLGKAGKKRYLGIRPTVRGAVMNPNDHPHGGGEGKNSVGYDSPRSPWGKRLMGVKTRNNKRPSTKLIIKRRKDK